MATGKGNSIKRDFIPSTGCKKVSEIDVLSPADMGKDFVKAGETPKVSDSNGHKQVNN